VAETTGEKITRRTEVSRPPHRLSRAPVALKRRQNRVWTRVGSRAEAAMAKARKASVAVLAPQDTRASRMPRTPMTTAARRATRSSSLSCALPLRMTSP